MIESKNHHQKRDRLVATLSQDNQYRFVIIKNKAMVAEAKTRHTLSNMGAFFLGKTMTGACLLASLLKGDERIIITIHPEKHIKLLYAEASQVGEVRGFIKWKESADQNLLENTPDSLGKGVFQVEKILYENFKPVYGSVENTQGDITSEFNQYLAFSEQIPSIMNIHTDIAQDGTVKESWGILLQALPGTSMEEIQSLYETICPELKIPGLIQEMPLEEVLKKILPYDFSITNNTPTDFFCRCSLEKFKQKLITLPLFDIIDMQKLQQNELVCQYCNRNYILKDEDFESLIEEIQSKQ
ncbi:MAG: Hsp33 family molecular chaperone HslO [Candidatus Brocadiae bacterium]|nr:Hsp33 family molecular chaperone HslO [Candidatus Brocadiia bacterium]